MYRFTGPRSYTGEDLAEFHLPGNPVLAGMLLRELTQRRAGMPVARLAEAGEFTARAWLNGRIDLTEAEGVAATIAAQSERELAAARQLAAGELSKRLRPVMDLLAATLALVEVGIDFVEEDVTFLSGVEIRERAGRAAAALEELVSQSARFERLSHEPAIVLAGRPNAGKSTLLNTLAGYERAVVSAVAGTTRDVLSAEVVLGRGMVRLIDAAGVEGEMDFSDEVTERRSDEGDGGSDPSSLHRSVAPSLTSQIEQAMRRRVLEAVAGADVLVLVRDVGDDRPAVELGREADLVVWTKADRRREGRGSGFRVQGSITSASMLVSAVTGEGMAALRRRLDELAFGTAGGEAALALNARHLEAVEAARGALLRARASSARQAGEEIIAMELREALDALGRILGSVSPDDLLGRIFSQFCIGK